MNPYTNTTNNNFQYNVNNVRKNNYINNQEENFLHQNFNYNIEDHVLLNAKNKLTDIQENFNNIHKQAYDLTKGPGNTSVYQKEIMDTNNLIPQNSNFLGPSFFQTPFSPDYPPRTSNVNYFNVYQNENLANNNNLHHNYDNNPNFFAGTPRQTMNNTNTMDYDLLQAENNYNPNLKNMQNNFNITNYSQALAANRSSYISSAQITDSIEGGNNMIQATPRTHIHGTGQQGFIPEGIEPKLQNIVSTANFKCALDLREIALKAKNAEYNPKRFAAVIMRIREPKTTALIFASGKMVCTGARSEDESKTAAKQYARIIKKLGFPVKFSEFKIQNIVGSCDVKFPIRLEGLSNEHSRFCNYEPEMFPGLIYRMIKPKIVLLIFVSGKLVLTGAKERNDIFEAFKKIYPVLLTYKKKDAISTCAEPTSNSDD